MSQRAGHPKQGLIHGLIAGGVPMDKAFVNVKVILIKGGIKMYTRKIGM